MKHVFITSVLCLAAISAPASAQDINRVRTLYVAAAYEEALAAIPAVETAENDSALATDLEQYRALCLLALGREPEAIAVVERLVRARPMFVPPAGDTSPKMQAVFAGVRTRIVPDAAKEAYVAGKADYESKNRAAARASFQRTLDLVDSLPVAEQKPLADLRLLAAEFLELSMSLPVPAAPVDPVPELAPAPSVPATPFVGPAVVREQLPPWNPPDSTSMRTEYIGLLRVLIGPDGRVESASMVKSTHPAYDVVALRAAKGWTYTPATRGGRPVSSQRDIQVRLVPR